MKNRILLVMFFICCFEIVAAQQRHKPKHELRPGLSIGYLPTWLLDDFRGNTRADSYMIGISGNQEIWKESILSFGVTRGKFVVQEDDEEFIGIIVPVKLQKYFNTDRDGFNLAMGMMINFCTDCSRTGGGSFLNEINYLFSIHPVDINIGLQTLLGSLLDDVAIQVGPQIQVIWHPRKNDDRH